MSSEPRADSERTDKLIGEVLANRYRVEFRLGEGAMGAVYKARHVKVGRPFAVKVLHPRLLEDHKVLQRFEREAELAGRLRHANVIGVVDVGETHDGLRYMVMDFAEGPDLSALLSEAPMPPQRIIHLTRQLLEGLYHAHTAGLIHRDFKPENVIVEKDSHDLELPRIVDFGIAILREGGDSSTGPGRLTTNGLVLGTPHYMAPEQAVNDPIDHRIDLFALGIMIYEMLCGKLPFDGNGAEVARANLMLDPPRISVRVPYLDVDPLLEAYSRRLMAKSPDARPPTAKVARELLDLIERDREAAAAALGIPLAVTRAPRTTEPVAPRGKIDDSYPGTFPPPIRDAIETPPQAPPMGGPIARRATLDRERDIATDTADPLLYQQRTSRRRALILAGAIAGTALLALVAVAVLKSKPGASAPAPLAAMPPPAIVDMQPVPPPQPPSPPPIEPPTAGSAAAAAAAAAGSAAPALPAIADARPVRHAKTQKVQVHASPQLLGAPPARVVIPPVSAPKPPTVYDVTAFVAELHVVGAELHAFVLQHPDAGSDLQSRFTRIDVNLALGSQAMRDAARTTLDQIHAEIVRRSK